LAKIREFMAADPFYPYLSGPSPLHKALAHLLPSFFVGAGESWIAIPGKVHMKILIGYDGSVDADGAIHDLGLAGLPAKTNAVVITFATPWVPFGAEGMVPPAFSIQYESQRKAAGIEARLLAERAAAQLRERFPHWKVKAMAEIREPALGFLEKAETWMPDLLVLGSHGRTALGRLLLGSVSQNVLHHAKGDVRITRPRIRTKTNPQRILIGVDGSQGSHAALAAVARRTWPTKTAIRLIGTVGERMNPGVALVHGGREYEETLLGLRREDMEEKVSWAVEKLALAGLDAEPSVLSGDPRSLLVKEAKAWNADVIFLGCRGLGAVDRFLVGSVSSAVASHAHCTVEVIRKQRPFPRKP
jgi:nucleotide-binding universal stress UspA family protein